MLSYIAELNVRQFKCFNGIHFRRQSWIGHTIRYNEFVVNILEGAISGKKTVGRP